MMRRRLTLVAVGTVAFAAWFWAMHKAVPVISIWRTKDGTEHYSFKYWTTATYCWAAVGIAGATVAVVAGVLLFASMNSGSEKRSHGFPIR